MKDLRAGTIVALVTVGLICTAISVHANMTAASAQTQPIITQRGTVKGLLCASILNATSTAASMTNNTDTSFANATHTMENVTGILANTTSTAEDPLLRSVAMAKTYVGQACEAIREGDTEQALGYLVVVERAVYSIQGNLTSTGTAANQTQNSASGSS